MSAHDTQIKAVQILQQGVSSLCRVAASLFEEVCKPRISTKAKEEEGEMKAKRYIVTLKQRKKWVDTWWTGTGDEDTAPLVTKRQAEKGLKVASKAFPEHKFRIEERTA